MLGTRVYGLRAFQRLVSRLLRSGWRAPLCGGVFRALKLYAEALAQSGRAAALAADGQGFKSLMLLQRIAQLGRAQD